MQDIKSKYGCPHCGMLPNPRIYIDSAFAYKMDGEDMVIPIKKMRLVKCCEGEFLAPYHKTGEDYLLAIHDKLAFFAPITPWIKDYIKSNKL